MRFAACLRSILPRCSEILSILCSVDELGVTMICAETKLVPVEALREFSNRVFRHFGCPREDAEQASDVLACADLRGIDSHGIARLHTYFDMFTLRRINPRPQIRVVRSTPSTATVDGDNGLLPPAGSVCATQITSGSRDTT